MPKKGFKSITVSEAVYNRFSSAYDKNKYTLEGKGVRSLSGYITYMLEERMQEDELLAERAPLIEKISVSEDRIILLDKMKNRVAEVVIQNESLFCQLCDNDSCVHIGYAHAIPEVHAILTARGVRSSI